MTSIWLQPQGRQEQELQNLIERLAEEQHTVSFRPHLTVCSVPDEPAVLGAAAAYIKECGFLPLKLAKTAADIEGRFDNGVAGEARRDRLEIGDFPGRAAAGHSVSSSLGRVR